MAKRELQPWDPVPDWHPARKEAFTQFRDMPDRTLKGCADALGKNQSLIRKWAKQDGWADRVAAWDTECDQRRQDEFTDADVILSASLASDAEKLRRALMRPAEALMEKLDKARERGEDPFRGMTAAEMVRLAATAGRAFAQVAQVERLATGQSTSNLGGHDGGPLVPGADIAAAGMADVEAYMLGRADEREQHDRAERS